MIRKIVAALLLSLGLFGVASADMPAEPDANSMMAPGPRPYKDACGSNWGVYLVDYDTNPGSMNEMHRSLGVYELREEGPQLSGQVIAIVFDAEGKPTIHTPDGKHYSTKDEFVAAYGDDHCKWPGVALPITEKIKL